MEWLHLTTVPVTWVPNVLASTFLNQCASVWALEGSSTRTLGSAPVYLVLSEKTHRAKQPSTVTFPFYSIWQHARILHLAIWACQETNSSKADFPIRWGTVSSPMHAKWPRAGLPFEWWYPIQNSCENLMFLFHPLHYMKIQCLRNHLGSGSKGLHQTPNLPALWTSWALELWETSLCSL